MSAQFREVMPNTGFDDQTPTGGPGIVLPYKSAATVMLEDGRDLRVSTVMKPMLAIDEIKDRGFQSSMVETQHPGSTPERARELAMLKQGALRVFKLTAHSLVGFGKAKIEAVQPRTSKAEATLKVIVLKEKRVTIAIRMVQVRDAGGNLVNAAKSFDAQVLLNQMNAIWRPQANVVFELSLTDPVAIDVLPMNAPANIQKQDLKAAFIARKDPKAALTFFMVKRALDGPKVVLGVTDPEAGIALISDDHSDSTMAHEAGHYLGSLSESGKFSMRYGHQGRDPKLLMRDGGAGYKIPFHMVTDFNKGYRA